MKLLCLYFYGQQAKQVISSNACGVEDILLTDSKQMISIKTLEHSRMDVEGSLKLLKKSLNNEECGNKINYYVFIKTTNNEKIDNIKVYDIPIERKNIPIFLENNIDSSKSYMGFIYTSNNKEDVDSKNYNNLHLRTVSFLKGRNQIRKTTSFRIPESVWKKYITNKEEEYCLDMSQKRHAAILTSAADMLNSHTIDFLNDLEQISQNVIEIFVDNIH